MISFPNYFGTIPEVVADFTIITCEDVLHISPPVIDWSTFEDINLTEEVTEEITIGNYIRVGDPDGRCLETL